MATVRNSLCWLALLAAFAVVMYTAGVNNDYLGEETD
jgi:hypothetical protein